MKKTRRIGVIGGGVYGTQMLKCFAAQQAKGRVTLAALADLDPTVLARHKDAFGVTGFADYRKMMAEGGLDAVAVATPDHMHAAVITAAVEHGLHVMSQKPLDVDSGRAAALVKACEDAGLLLYVDFHKRFDPAHIRLRDDIAAGRLGRLQYGHVHMEDKIVVPVEWLNKWAAQSSPSWFLGIHFYDLVHWLTGLRPQRVLASGQKGKLESLGLSGAWDSIQAKVEYEQGFTVSYDLSWILPNSFPSIVNQAIRLVGEEGIAEVDSQDRGFFCAYGDSPGSAVINPFGALEYTHPLFGAVTEGYTFQSMAQFVDVLDALGQGRTLADIKGSYPDGRSALVSTRIGEAVDRGLASGVVEAIAASD